MIHKPRGREKPKMVFISPKQILAEFLRHRMTDPRSRAETSQTEEFNGGGKIFCLTPTSGSVSCITGITVDGSAVNKWKDYYIDFQNEKVIFYSNTAGGTNNVDITYKRGSTNWIYPDKAKTSLGATSFPRLNILLVGGTGERVGQYNSNIESVPHFQVDVWAKENYIKTLNSVKYEGDKLAEYLGYQVTKAFEDYIDNLHPQLYSYRLLSPPRDMGFNKEYQCFHIIVEFELKGIDIGES